MFDLAQKLLSLSLEMEHLSQADEWQKVEEIQTQRAALIAQIASSDLSELSEKEARELADLITQSQAAEQRCTQLAERQRGTLTSQHTKVSKGKAMQKAYGAQRPRR